VTRAKTCGLVLASLSGPMPLQTNASPHVPPHVAETVEALAKLHALAECNLPRHQRSVEVVAAVMGRPIAVGVIGAFVILWVAVNVSARSFGVHAVDPPPFAGLQAICSVGALLMGTTVLAAQNRQRRVADEHAHLDLQINLLAEHKIAKVISLLEELRRDMPNVANRIDHVAEAMTQAVDPHAVASALKDTIDTELSAHQAEPSSG
jgi:uncharacterized membrane protein